MGDGHDHVRIAVDDRGWEDVPATNLHGDEWELTRSPLYALGVAAGDVVRATGERGRGEYYVVRRGGNVCVQVYMSAELADDVAATREAARMVEALLEPHRGRIDGLTAGLFSSTVHVTAGFPAIEAVFREVVERWPGAQWQFTNVFDFRTRQPLNWWHRLIGG